MCLLILCLKADLAVYPTWSLLSFLDVLIHIFHPLWEFFFQPLFLQLFFLSLSLLFFWDSHYAYVNMLVSVPWVSQVLFIFLGRLFGRSQAGDWWDTPQESLR